MFATYRALQRARISGPLPFITEPDVVEKLSYSINEAAKAAKIGRTKLYELINDGELPLVKIGSRSLIRRVDLEALLARSIQAAA